jgi:hypothetical protein
VVSGYRLSYIHDRKQYRKYNPVLDISTRDPTKARRKAIWSLVVTVEQIPRTDVFLTAGIMPLGEKRTLGAVEESRKGLPNRRLNRRLHGIPRSKMVAIRP